MKILTKIDNAFIMAQDWLESVIPGPVKIIFSWLAIMAIISFLFAFVATGGMVDVFQWMV